MSIEHTNRLRNERLLAPYDPVRGVGCYGNRCLLEVNDKVEGGLWLPSQMSRLKSVQLLEKWGSVGRAVEKGLGVQHDDGTIADYFWLKFCEERYQYDFEFYTYSCDTILDKETGVEIRFQLNRPQREILLPALEEQRVANRQILVQILKARQMGFSTMVQMYMKWIQMVHRKNWNSVVVSDDLTSAINIRSMYDLSVRKMPPIGGQQPTIAPFAGTQNIKIIPERGSRITVGTAQRPETVRSQDVKMAHFSEVAFYPHTDNNNPSMLESSIVSSIPNVPYSMVVRESTANGVGDYFYNHWTKAKQGESGYRAVFAPWYAMDIYRISLDDGYYIEGKQDRTHGSIDDFYHSLSQYERSLWEQDERVTLEHLNWRRWKLSTMSDTSKMRQEFPSNDIEAFVDSGQPVFRADEVEQLRSTCMPPLWVGDLIGSGEVGLAVLDTKERSKVLQGLTFKESTEALEGTCSGDEVQYLRCASDHLQVWSKPDDTIRMKGRYIVSFDPQRGITASADWGVIKVFDRYWMTEGEVPEVVATYFGHTDKDIMIWKAAQIAKWYNDALLVVESNTYDSSIREVDGEFIFDVIADHYPNLYCRTERDKVREGRPLRYGFQTNRASKPMVINHLKALFRERGYIERDTRTLDEARTYEVKDNGSMGARAGMHDDRLMATAIGLWVCYDEEPPTILRERKEINNKRRPRKRIAI